MKVTLERNHLLKSLSHVHRVVERRNTYPILANVLFKASDDTVELRATDLDIEVTESVPAMVGTPGTTTVPAHTLYEIVRKLSRRRRSAAGNRWRRADDADLGPFALQSAVPVARQFSRSEVGQFRP